MWKRKDLKNRAKASFRRNYWKTFLVALMLTVIVAAGGSASTSGGSILGMRAIYTLDPHSKQEEVYNYEEMFGEDGEIPFGVTGDADNFTITIPDSSSFYVEDEDTGLDIFEDIRSGEFDVEEYLPLIIAGGLIIGLIALIAVAIAIIIEVFILNPLEVGACRFFYKNLDQPAEIKEVAFAFDHSFKNIANIMFFKGLFEFLWGLLFIIPGIIKSYEYSMIPYLIGEYPDMPKEDAFAISKYMMKGNKWKAFILDLSFILWHLLSALTAGIVGTFYVAPYIDQTKAAMYDAIKAEK